MALDPEFLRYPRRRRGMDHDWYEWSQLHERRPVEWPDGARLALWINVCVQFTRSTSAASRFQLPAA